MPRQRDMNVITSLFLPQVCSYWKTPQGPHSLNKTTLKGIRSPEKKWRKEAFLHLSSPTHAGQAFPRCTLRPSSSTPSPLVPSSAARASTSTYSLRIPKAKSPNLRTSCTLGLSTHVHHAQRTHPPLQPASSPPGQTVYSGKPPISDTKSLS